MKEKIKEVLITVKPGMEVYDGENLIGDMGIDSHDIFNVVVGLEEKFDIEIEPLYLKASNFASVDNIEKMIRKIKGC